MAKPRALTVLRGEDGYPYAAGSVGEALQTG